MILAEIVDKMLPSSFYGVAIVVSGVVAAVVLTFLRGIPRILVVTMIACVAGFLALGLQVDHDLVEAARNELGDSYITISRYWIVASIALSIVLTMIFQGLARSFNSAQNQQAEQ